MAGQGIPVTLVTGFLGAGKTTLINRLLGEPDLSDTAVIVNEFGAVAIDHLLVEQAGDDIIALADGCLCCTVRGALVDTLTDLCGRLADGRAGALRRVIIETTGLADPIPVLQALASHAGLAETFRLDGVVTVVDAVNGALTLDEHEEARRQVAVADRLVLSKSGLAERDGLAALSGRLAELAPGIAPVMAESAPASALVGIEPPGTFQRAAQCHHGHGDHEHGRSAHAHGTPYQTVLLGHERAMPAAAVEGFLDLLRSRCGEQILRVKGLVETVEAPGRPRVVQGVRQVLSPARHLERWPDGGRGARLVVIGRGLDETYVRGLFDAFAGEARVDTPDRAALLDNPLAIAGFRR